MYGHNYILVDFLPLNLRARDCNAAEVYFLSQSLVKIGFSEPVSDEGRLKAMVLTAGEDPGI